MQKRYAGDFGDYVKLALLRQLSVGRKLGIGWYLHPDETRGNDGKHIRYLSEPEVWRDLDPELFDCLSNVVRTERSVEALQRFANPIASFGESLISATLDASERKGWRAAWFARQTDALANCDLVFADPDNGLVDDDSGWARKKTSGKRISLHEARKLSADRAALIYHHNTRRKGGHDKEVDYWLEKFAMRAMAVRAARFGFRTFFILNPDDDMESRVRSFCHAWKAHNVWLHGERPIGFNRS